MSIDIRGMATLLQVFDMSTSLDFYGRVLQFDIVTTAGPPEDIGWALLQYGEIELMLNTAYEAPDRPATADLVRFAAHSDTILYFACADVDAAYTQLRAFGLDVREPTVAPYGMKQLYIRDPDGFGLCFQRPVADG